MFFRKKKEVDEVYDPETKTWVPNPSVNGLDLESRLAVLKNGKSIGPARVTFANPMFDCMGIRCAVSVEECNKEIDRRVAKALVNHLQDNEDTYAIFDLSNNRIIPLIRYQRVFMERHLKNDQRSITDDYIIVQTLELQVGEIGMVIGPFVMEKREE